jgi:hypothetical protein
MYYNDILKIENDNNDKVSEYHEDVCSAVMVDDGSFTVLSIKLDLIAIHVVLLTTQTYLLKLLVS